jgi:prepilin-type N-terminal cleavage/methylation domain-containing protein
LGMRRGFTFIEVVISLALVSFLAAGLARMLILAVAVTGRADRTSALTALAVEKLEVLKTLPAEDESLAEGDHEDVVQSGACPGPFRRSWRVETLEDGAKKIELVVSAPGAPPKTFRAVLFLAPELGFRP